MTDMEKGFYYCEQSLASLGSMAPGQSLVIVRTNTWLIIDHSHSSAGPHLKLWHSALCASLCEFTAIDRGRSEETPHLTETYSLTVHIRA